MFDPIWLLAVLFMIAGAILLLFAGVIWLAARWVNRAKITPRSIADPEDCGWYGP